MATPSAGGGSDPLVQLLTRLLAVQEQQNERIDNWVNTLQVVNPLYEFDRDYTTYKKVNNQSGIRSK